MPIIEKYYIENLSSGLVLYPDGTPDYIDLTEKNRGVLSGLWQRYSSGARYFDTRESAISHLSNMDDGEYRIFSRIEKVADN